MSNISGLLGTAGGFKGTGVDAPSNWVDDGKLNAANQNVQTQMGNQTGLLTALQGQNGLGNQSSVYNQLQGVANGTGPNPAQAQLAQATAANTANQAALMAGQRGSSQNTGLMARQAAMQGGANQQNSAGQAATLQAQQSLGALGQMGGMANTMAANQIGQTNANQQAAQANLNSMLTGNSNQNAIKSGLIQATAQQQASGLGGGVSGAGSAMSSFGGSSGGGAEAAGANGGKPEDMPMMGGGGIIGMFGKMASMMADGGDVQSLSGGPQSIIGQHLASLDAPVSQQSAQFNNGALSNVEEISAPPIQTWGNEQMQKGMQSGAKSAFKQKPQATAADKNSADMQPPTSEDAGAMNEADMGDSGGDDEAMAEGGRVKALLSPGEKYLTPKEAQAAKHGKVDPMKAGKTVPGKPKVGGAKNSYANDFVKADLEKGGLVLPRSVTQSKNPHWAAMRFVHAHMMANGGKVGIAAKSKGKKK